jgi:colanic acid/amylovoran biosynthesis glycosyltransferase
MQIHTDITEKPLKVVHCKASFGILTENWVYYQVLHLDKKAMIKLYSITHENGDSFPLDNLQSLHGNLGNIPLLLNRIWNRFFHWYPQILIWLRKDRPNLIHAHFGPDGCKFLPYAKLSGIPLITSFYGYDAYIVPQKNATWRRKYTELFKQGRLFLAEGPAMRDKLIEIGCPPEKIVIHHIGIEPDKYKFQVRKPDGQIRLLVCGRFVEKKGIPYAIEALKHVISKTKADVRLTIVGDSNHEGALTAEKKKILNAIEKYDISDAVTLTGFIPHNELTRIIYDHHIFLAPSIHSADGNAEGGFPVILTEVLASGMPIVAFNHCDIPEIIQDGITGLMAPEHDINTFVDKLTYLIEHPDIWPEMGQAGRAYVEANYDIHKLNDRLIEIYKSLLNN